MRLNLLQAQVAGFRKLTQAVSRSVSHPVSALFITSYFLCGANFITFRHHFADFLHGFLYAYIQTYVHTYVDFCMNTL